MTGKNRRLAGAVGGGVAAGLGITALLLVMERKSGKPSEIAQLGRASAAKLGVETPPADALPSMREQALVQGGHLLLSALAGAAFAATVDEDAAVVPSGAAFGLGFYALAHWIAGPALGVKPPEWKADAGTLAMHTANHLLFGLATAWAAQRAGRAGESADVADR